MAVAVEPQRMDWAIPAHGKGGHRGENGGDKECEADLQTSYPQTWSTQSLMPYHSKMEL